MFNYCCSNYFLWASSSWPDDSPSYQLSTHWSLNISQLDSYHLQLSIHTSLTNLNYHQHILNIDQILMSSDMIICHKWMKYHFCGVSFIRESDVTKICQKFWETYTLPACTWVSNWPTWKIFIEHNSYVAHVIGSETFLHVSEILRNIQLTNLYMSL